MIKPDTKPDTILSNIIKKRTWAPDPNQVKAKINSVNNTSKGKFILDNFSCFATEEECI